jgi:phosphoribosylamine--glycine ligase
LKILVLGSGGREHAIAWRLAQSPSVRKLYAAPGNPGIGKLAECLKPRDSTAEGFLHLADAVGADLTVVGPEAPLVAGVVDRFRQAGRLIVGPTAAAARLEGSKIFAKQSMVRFGVPTAAYATVDTYAEALRALEGFSYPLVLKADGLAAGKGVVIVQDRQEAERTLDGLLSGALVGSAGSRLVIEEFLSGEEVSFIALSDGERILPLEPTQDHKAVFDDDKGPNTGGMGAYCDSRILTPSQTDEIIERVMLPVITGMRRDGCPFAGFLYAGLMMTAGGPKVLEFNVRLGDPETQALMHRMNCDFAPLLMAAAKGDLAGAKAAWHEAPSVCVVMASEGYPGTPRTGDVITGIDDAEVLGAAVFHAGTRLSGNDLVTSGGRVLSVTASGPDLPEAIERAYEGVAKIHFRGMHYRRDIGRKGLKRWPSTLQ